MLKGNIAVSHIILHTIAWICIYFNCFDVFKLPSVRVCRCRSINVFVLSAEDMNTNITARVDFVLRISSIVVQIHTENMSVRY